jgi:N-formylglutamate amidohydrolase
MGRAPAIEELFKYYPANGEFKGIVTIPHSGEWVPEEFLPYLCGSEREMLEDVDYKVDELVDITQMQNAGISVVVANIHRVCVDLNRTPAMSILYWTENTHGVKLVENTPESNQIEQFILKYHQTYYAMIKSILDHYQSEKLLPAIDLHSMPSAPTEYHLKKNPKQSMTRSDFCLSDLHGSSCSKEFITAFGQELTAHYSVAFNNPYFGGYGTQFFNQFHTNSMQIEINRSIYMDEKQKTLDLLKVQKLKPILTQSFIKIFTKF